MSTKFEVIDNHAKLPKNLGVITCKDGGELEFKPNTLEHYFTGITILVGGKTLTLDDGLDFIRAIPHHYRSGYITVRRVE